MINVSHNGDLKKHKLKKHEGVSYPCSECDMKYADKTGLRRHLIQKHEGVKYGCDHCDYSATRVETLKNHVAIRHDYGQQNYFCKQCDFQGKTRQHVQSHQSLSLQINHYLLWIILSFKLQTLPERSVRPNRAWTLT